MINHDGENILGKGNRLYPRAQTLLVSLMILIVLILANTYLSGREKYMPKAMLSSLPLEIGEWKSKGDEPIEEKIMNMLQLSDYVNRTYVSPSGKIFSLYVGFVSIQEEQPMIHTPLVCLPGSGYVVSNEKLLPWWNGRKDKKEKKVNLITVEQGQSKLLICYWYQANQRIMANDYVYRFFLLWDAIFKKRTDGALVRFMTPMSLDESPMIAEERLKNYVQLLIPIINKELPE